MGYAWFAEPWWPGAGVGILGALLRFWASGYLVKDTRPAVGGPYRWVRNPLYVGTLLTAWSATWILASPWAFVGVTLAFLAVYLPIVWDEEVKLSRIFGSAYQRYRALVPRFLGAWPASREALAAVNPEPAARAFSWSVAWRNRAYEAFFSLGGICAAIWAVRWARQLFG